jgi:hypothetical protein
LRNNAFYITLIKKWQNPKHSRKRPVKKELPHIIKFFNPPFSYLLENLNKIKGDYICRKVANRNDFTLEEKREILPNSQYKFYIKYRLKK